MASTTPTAHFFVEWHLCFCICQFLCYCSFRSAKDFPHIYNARNLRKTAPPVARECRRTLIFISCCEDVVLIRNQQEYRDSWFHL